MTMNPEEMDDALETAIDLLVDVSNALENEWGKGSGYDARRLAGKVEKFRDELMDGFRQERHDARERAAEGRRLL